MSFRENLKSQLQYADISVKELASLSGVKKQTLDSYLSTHNNVPSAEIAVKIAGALGVSVESLVMGEEKTPQDEAGSSSNLRETRLLKEIFNGLTERNKKMALALIKTIKKQDDLEKTAQNA
jgi:transcriptional regulator with XRE-family HTH domain